MMSQPTEAWLILGRWPSQKRDTQRKRVYDAETQAARLFTFRTYTDLHDVRRFLARVLIDPWFIKRWPWCTPDRLKVADGRGRRSAGCCKRGFQWVLKYPRWARYDLVILHELCHVIAEPVKPDHGPFFARCLLELTRQYIGEDAAGTLRVAYREHGVRFLANGESRKVAV